MDVPTPANDAILPPRSAPAQLPPNVLAAHLALDLGFVADQLDELMVRLFDPANEHKRLSQVRASLILPLQVAINRCRKGLDRR